MLRARPARVLVSLTVVALVTFVAYRLIEVNATTVGYAYLLLILVIATAWGFFEAALSSILATVVFNFFFLPPIGTFTIADPQNWVALSSFLATSLIASRLSAVARARASEAIERQRDLERLYTFSRAILLTDKCTPIAQQLIERLSEIFKIDCVVLYERHTGNTYCVGTAAPEGLGEKLRNAASSEAPSIDVSLPYLIVGVSRGSEAVASMAVRESNIPRSLLQSVANLVAIGLERAQAEDLAREVEAARRSEQLRTTLIDAMAHEFKTPLTLIKAATTSLLANPDVPPQTRMEQLTIADEEAEHLRQLVDDAIEMARLDTTRIEIHPEMANLNDTLKDVLASLQTEVDEHPIKVVSDPSLPPTIFDKRLMKLAIRQLLDNALKYTDADTAVEMSTQVQDGMQTVEVTDYGQGIPADEQARIFERFYRSPAVKSQIPGSGLGLSITDGIVRAHNGELTVSSQAGRTTFRITMPVVREEVA